MADPGPAGEYLAAWRSAGILKQRERAQSGADKAGTKWCVRVRESEAMEGEDDGGRRAYCPYGQGAAWEGKRLDCFAKGQRAQLQSGEAVELRERPANQLRLSRVKKGRNTHDGGGAATQLIAEVSSQIADELID